MFHANKTLTSRKIQWFQLFMLRLKINQFFTD